jgi:gamma-D-glutamyl-L-lysine dipeptidyl-peptidase
MPFAVVSVPAAPVRRKPRHQREMSNQLLFGEAVEILREKGSLWVKVRSLHDHYEGWMTRNLLEEMDEENALSIRQFVTADLLNIISVQGIETHVPLGASLPMGEKETGKLGKLTVDYRGRYIDRMIQAPTGELVETTAKRWLNAPYLWGGRTILGVDCSGFVQVNFKMVGIDLPRDAWQQAQQGHAVKKLRDAVKGDLAFFDDKEEIVHVGILLSNSEIIHASGKVRIDQIDKKGITNSTTGKRTHSLRSIRRFF